MSALPIRIFLALAGVIAVGLGSLILIAPVAFYASYGLDLGGQVTLLNELRSHGLSLIGIGAFIGAGAFLTWHANLSLAITAFFYLSYGLSRLVGVAFDGWPAQGLVVSGAIELAVGGIALAVFLTRRGHAALTTA